MSDRITLGTVLVAAALVFSAVAQATAESGAVKKSGSGICHCPGGQHYGRIKNFTAYPSIQACLDSGGQHPKRGQGDCGTAEPPAEPKDKQSTGPAKAADGDALIVKGAARRLQGIGAPESGRQHRSA